MFNSSSFNFGYNSAEMTAILKSDGGITMYVSWMSPFSPLIHSTVHFCKSIHSQTTKRLLSNVDNSLFCNGDSISMDSTTNYLTICKIAALYNKELAPVQLLEISKLYSSSPDSKINLALYNKLTGLNRQSDRVEIDDLLIILQSLSNANIRNYDEFSFCSEVIKRKLNKMYNKQLREGEIRKYKPNKDGLFAIFYVFTNARILHFPLFEILCKLYMSFVKDSNWYELDTIVKCLAMHKHRNQTLLNEIQSAIATTCDQITPETATRLLYNYSLLSKVDEPLLNSLERHIYRVTNATKTRGQYVEQIINNKIELDNFSAGLILYSYLLLKLIDYKLIVKLLELQKDFLQKLPEVIDTLTVKELAHGNRLYFIRSYLRVLHKEFYRELPIEIRVLLRNLTLINPNKFDIKERVFQQKVSWHLTKMRIAHSLSVYRSGLNLDIVERDKRVVWQCNSYHRFYANSFKLTAQVELEHELIRSLGYCIVNIQYYQWNRMMIKDTRFAYLRMARYYALQDHREFDKSLMGWNLPYLWKNSKKSRIMANVSYAYNYQPLSHSPYTH